MRARQERVHRDRTSARGGDGSRSGLGQDGHLPLAALSRAQARGHRRLCEVRDVPHLNLPLTHPVNIALRGGHGRSGRRQHHRSLPSGGLWRTTVNYNRDVEIFPVLRATMERHLGGMSVPVAHRYGREHGGGLLFRRRRAARRATTRSCAAISKRRGDQTHGRGRGGPEEDRALMNQAGINQNLSPPAPRRC